MFNSLFSVFSALLLVLSHHVTAAPVKPLELLAVAPTITSPNEASIWAAGSKQNVSWLTSNIPAAAQNYTLVILLGQPTNDSENLNIKNPLATQVPIMAGTVEVQVPVNTSYGSNYVVAVIGDSGNISPKFTILSKPLVPYLH